MNSRRPPPSGAPPSYAFVSRVYGRSMRPVVFIIAGMGAIWTLFSSISSFQDLHLEHTSNQPKLAPLSIALGALYITVFAIELYGVFSAISQRLAFVRSYAYASILAALLVIGASFLRTIVHFTLKNDLINECTDVATNQTVSFTFGIWGPTNSQTLNSTQAQSWCSSAWSHDSFSEIISLIVVIILSILFSVVAFSFYRQVLDPASPANAMRAPSNQVRMGAYPSHYSPPYNASVPSLGYNYPSTYAPPAGMPPPRDEAFAPPYDPDNKLPKYGASLGDKMGAYEGDGKDDPFSDFDGPSGPGGEERDVTSRPHPSAEG